MKSGSSFTIEDVTKMQNQQNHALIQKIFEFGFSLGCKCTISNFKDTDDDWKCEFFIPKPKNSLFILRVKGNTINIRAKLFHIAEYEQTVAACTDSVKESLIESSNCGGHPGGCAGPVKFVLGGQAYEKCRHSICFDELKEDDWSYIQTLIIEEIKHK